MTSSYGLHGRAALVTGGSRGIGLEVARQLADAGALVCVTARDREDVRRAADGLGGIGLAGSVADPAHLRAAVDLVLREFGRLDVVVNNAATNQPYGPLMEVDPDAWREAFTVNVEAPLRLVREAWRAWMREHGGSVVNVCTEGAAHVGPHVGAYGTSKAALLHLTQQLATPSPPASYAPRWRGSCGRRGPSSCRSAGSASPRTSRGPWCGSRPTRPGGSPGRICWWTGAPGCGRRTRAGTPSMTGYGPTGHRIRDGLMGRARCP